MSESPLGDEEGIRASAVFSPGPWPGFNGLVELVLTAEEVQLRSPINEAVLRSVDLSRITKLTVSNRKRRSGVVVSKMVIHAGGQRRMYASKDEQASFVIDELIERLDPSLITDSRTST